MSEIYQNEYYRALNQIAKAIKLESEINQNRFKEISKNIDKNFLQFLELTNGLDFSGRRIPITPKDLKNIKDLWALREILKRTLENTYNQIDRENLELVIKRIDYNICLIYARCINYNRNLPDVIKSSLKTIRLDKKPNVNYDEAEEI